MRNGTHVVYVIESRKVAEAKGDSTKPAPLKKPWDWAHYNTFDHVIIEWKDHATYKHPAAAEEWHDSHRACQVHGFYTLKYCVAALKRVKKAHGEKYKDKRDDNDRYSVYEFRLMKHTITYNKDVTPITDDDLIDALG